MSIKAVKEILDRASKDSHFRKALLNDPLKELAGYELSEKERDKFKNISEETLVAYKNNLDRRYSKDGSGGASDDWWIESVTD